MCQQGKKSKVLEIYCVTAESEIIDAKLIELKLWNGTHAKCISFKIKNSEVKIGTLHVCNMKNVEARYEVSENMNVMENFIAGDETHVVKDNLLNLIANDMRLFLKV